MHTRWYTQAITFRDTTVIVTKFYVTLHWTFQNMGLRAFLVLCKHSEIGTLREILVAVYACTSGAEACEISQK